MGWKILLILSALTAVTEAAPSVYMVAAPKVIRPGSKFSVNVDLLQSQDPVTVKATIIDSRGNEITTPVMKSLAPGESGILDITLPMAIRSGKYNLTVEAPGSFKNSTEVTVQMKSKSIFIQTDKAIYKAGQTVRFRTFALYPSLKPVSSPINISIYDAKNNKIKQWLDQKDPTGVISQDLQLSDEPILGDWKIKAEIQGEKFEKTISIEEYVLPKFKVDVELESYVVLNQSVVAGSVLAKYTYGKGVKATVMLKATVQNTQSYYGPPPVIANIERKITIDDVSGKADFSFTMKELTAMLRKGDTLRNKEIHITANVTDVLTKNFQVGSGKVTVYRSRVKLEILKSTLANFKPGLKYSVYLKVSQPDGQPIQSREAQSVNITLTQNMRKGTPAYESVLETVTGMGFIHKEFTIRSDASSLMLSAMYVNDNSIYSRKSNILPFKSVNSQSIQVVLISKASDLKVGQDGQFQVKASQAIRYFTYFVMAKGNIVKTEKIQAAGTEKLFTLPLTTDMAPTARIVVYAAVTSTNPEIIADSLEFSTEGAFANNEVDLKFLPSNKTKPGEEITLELQAAPGSFVGVLAVDQSVLLLKTGNDIKQSDVTDELRTYDTSEEVRDNFPFPWWRGGGMMVDRRRRKRSIFPPYSWGGSDSSKTFKNAGCVVMTNADIYQEPYGGLVLESAAVPDAGAMMPKNDKGSSSTAGVSYVRKFFPETWLWKSGSVG